MNTFLSSAQEKVAGSYADFARQVVAPVAVALESGEHCLRDFMQEIGQAGFLGVTVPQEYGGQGQPFINAVLFIEAVSRYEPGLGLTLASHFAFVEVLKRYASDRHKSRYLPLLARGELFAAFAVSEKNAGSDFEALETRLDQAGGKLSVTGEKVWVVTGEIAALFLILARSGSEASLALALMDAGEAPTLAVLPGSQRLGLRSAIVNEIRLAAHEAPAEGLLATGEKAREVILFAMDAAKTALSASAVGLASGALDLAAEHARQRKQFGAEIGQLQAVQWKIADHATETTAAQLIVYRAGWAMDEMPAQFRKLAAMAKWFAARVARVHSGEALQILASAGLCSGSPAERFYRDAKMMEIVYGTTEMQKVSLATELGI